MGNKTSISTKTEIKVFDMMFPRGLSKIENSLKGVSHFIYFFSMTDMYKKCYFDDITNRFEDNLEKFCEILSLSPFMNQNAKKIIVVLSKYDLLVKQLENESIPHIFEDFKGTTPEDHVDYMVNKIKIATCNLYEEIHFMVANLVDKKCFLEIEEKMVSIRGEESFKDIYFIPNCLKLKMLTFDKVLLLKNVNFNYK